MRDTVAAIADLRPSALREFEDRLDLLLDKFLADLAERMPWQFIEIFGDENVRRIGNTIAVKDAEIEFDLQNRIDEAYADFAWELTHLLRTLNEKVR
jgi:hypothetical protein